MSGLPDIVEDLVRSFTDASIVGDRYAEVADLDPAEIGEFAVRRFLASNLVVSTSVQERKKLALPVRLSPEEDARMNEEAFAQAVAQGVSAIAQDLVQRGCVEVERREPELGTGTTTTLFRGYGLCVA